MTCKTEKEENRYWICILNSGRRKRRHPSTHPGGPNNNGKYGYTQSIIQSRTSNACSWVLPSQHGNFGGKPSVDHRVCICPLIRFQAVRWQWGREPMTMEKYGQRVDYIVYYTPMAQLSSLCHNHQPYRRNVFSKFWANFIARIIIQFIQIKCDTSRWGN